MVIGKPAITDKEFYKAMQKLKDRGTNAVPPKKSASAYIIFGKEVSTIFQIITNPISLDRNVLKSLKETPWLR
jgi:hypothetical protein